MVCDDAAYFLDQIHLAVAGQVPDGAARGGVLARVRALLRFHDGLGEGGQYGVSTAAELRVLARVSRQCGIVLDPTYGGKAFYSLARMLATPAGRAHFVAPDSALFVHTGGMFSMFSKEEQLLRDAVFEPRQCHVFHAGDVSDSSKL